MLKQYHYTSLSYQKHTLQDGYQMICCCLLRGLWSQKCDKGFCAHLHFSTRIFDFLRASSIFYVHLRHDQDFPSDTRPRDDPASRLAPGHALVTPPFGLTVATPVAGSLQSCLSSRLPLPSGLLPLCVSSWVIRYISGNTGFHTSLLTREELSQSYNRRDSNP